MSAARHLLDEVRAVGIDVTARGDKLHLVAPAGTITPELREVLAANKAELLELACIEAATDQRVRLLALAIGEGLDADLVHALPDADLLAIPADYTDRNLRAYVRALDADRRMDAGMIPVDWGVPVAVTCEGCGPVLLWPTSPPVVKACPWCFKRKAGKTIPRPRVQVSNGVLNGFTDKGVTPAMREVLRTMRGET